MGQNEKSLDKELKRTKYTRSGNYKGTNVWQYQTPPSLLEEQTLEEQNNVSNLNDSMLEMHHELYQKHLKKAQKKERDLLKQPELLDMPEFEEPDFDGPDIGDPDDLPKGLWTTLLFIIIAILLVLIFYFLFKKGIRWDRFGSKMVDHWNPEVVSESDFESRLSKALKKERYREAVRIYFTLILKELIRLNQIKWKRDKTNHLYLLEIKNKSFSPVFSKCIHVFDVVWYGEYEIDKEKYDEVAPLLIAFLSSLKNSTQ